MCKLSVQLGDLQGSSKNSHAIFSKWAKKYFFEFNKEIKFKLKLSEKPPLGSVVQATLKFYDPNYNKVLKRCSTHYDPGTTDGNHVVTFSKGKASEGIVIKYVHSPSYSAQAFLPDYLWEEFDIVAKFECRSSCLTRNKDLTLVFELLNSVGDILAEDRLNCNISVNPRRDKTYQEKKKPQKRSYFDSITSNNSQASSSGNSMNDNIEMVLEVDPDFDMNVLHAFLAGLKMQK